ncbi:RNA polymerase-binding ATPase [Gammaproteobacteria bacterium 45_16_T64]|mgnify:CR=1 FL=1|nr:RNA polymerase-binding ATPase [Gammaproteobacteria bacterium 45_16_T64]
MGKQLFQPGQRWANTAEPELGAGIITQVEGRTITLFFPNAEDSRTYSAANAPLSRVEFRIGDIVENNEGVPFTVEAINQVNGLLIYAVRDEVGGSKDIVETQIHGSSAHTGPVERLLMGQTDRYRAFSLRYETWQKQNSYSQSRIAGLSGPRVDLIPHQFHIANEVANRVVPRVMLADEVGLGKTIEAGLIMHRLIQQGRLNRVLILVPSPLIHQWLVEMMRRFNLNFRILDDTQCDAICTSQMTDNPFMSEQLVLCSRSFLMNSPQWQEKALEAEWDMLVVDEAHHLAWEEGNPSAGYSLVDQFSQIAKGLLLLTATPEKEGHQSHFAQLRLLDPARYHSLADFVAQQKSFEPIANIAERLMDHEPLDDGEIDKLSTLLQDSSSQALIASVREEDDDHQDAKITLAKRLLDQQGTGRVLFRNTRESIADFPQRQLHSHPLPLPSLYEDLAADPSEKLTTSLYPEYDFDDETWIDEDPRVAWLIETLKKNKLKKYLIICHHQSTACALEKFLTLKGGVLCAAFHEHLSIIERDRAAAWFADLEGGAQALVCSEIGSEGRNFQFCSELVLFDLPVPVDLLEQRIGRLDRIGQKNDIQIHAPYFENSVQEKLHDWYHQGMNAFEQTNAASSVVFSHHYEEFKGLAHGEQNDFDSFIENTRTATDDLQQQFKHGRNRLLELQSKGDQHIEPLLEEIRTEDGSDELELYLDKVFNQYGVDSEDLCATTVHIRPGKELENDHFPFLSEDGITATYHRSTALSREDCHFLTWDHPMVRGAIDMVVSGEKGKASVCLLKNKQIKEGSLLVEALFVIHCSAPPHLQLGRFLPTIPVRVLLDTQGRNLSQAASSSALDKQLKNARGELVAAIIKEYRKDIDRLVKAGAAIAQTEFETAKTNAVEGYAKQLNEEIHRLEQLREHNSSISSEDIDTLRKNLNVGSELLSNGSVISLDAVRVMVAVS